MALIKNKYFHFMIHYDAGSSGRAEREHVPGVQDVLPGLSAEQLPCGQTVGKVSQVIIQTEDCQLLSPYQVQQYSHNSQWLRQGVYR